MGGGGGSAERQGKGEREMTIPEGWWLWLVGCWGWGGVRAPSAWWIHAQA